MQAALAIIIISVAFTRPPVPKVLLIYKMITSVGIIDEVPSNKIGIYPHSRTDPDCGVQGYIHDNSYYADGS